MRISTDRSTMSSPRYPVVNHTRYGSLGLNAMASAFHRLVRSYLAGGVCSGATRLNRSHARRANKSHGVKRVEYIMSLNLHFGGLLVTSRPVHGVL